MSDKSKILRSDNNGEYNIKLNRQQLETIASSLECTSRMRCGQLGLTYMPPIQDVFFKMYDELGGEKWSDVRDEITKHLDAIKMLIWKTEPNAHHGIGYHPQSDMEYEMYKIIRSRFESERESLATLKGEKYSGNVHTGTPLKMTDVPFMRVDPVEDLNIHEKIKHAIRKRNEINELECGIKEYQDKCDHFYIDYGMNTKYLYLQCQQCGKIIEVEHEIGDVRSIISDASLNDLRTKIVSKYNKKPVKKTKKNEKI